MEEIKITKKEQKELFVKAMLGSPFFTTVASVLMTFIIAAVFFKLSGPVPISVTQSSIEKVSTFDVTGEGKSYATPDEAQVNFGLSKEGVSVESVQDTVNTTINQFVDGLKEMGVKEELIKTTAYNVYPRYDYNGGKSRITGYEVSTNVRVKFTDFELVNDGLDLAGEMGLNQVGGLQFLLSDETEDKAMGEARKQAIAEAEKKAKELAGLAGMSLGKIVNVQEGGGYYPRALPMAGGGLMEDVAEVSTEVQPGTSEIVVNVTLSYETR